MVESAEKLEKNWVKVYPIYIDKGVKLSEGRKVSIANSAENPTAKDIYAVCSQFLGLNCKIEPVFYNFYFDRKVILKTG